MEPTPNQEFHLSDLLACVAREVAMRKSCYPKWDKVTSLDQLSPNRKKELAMMQAVGFTLTAQSELITQLVEKQQAAQPAPLADAELRELVRLHEEATPAPWTQWAEHGALFYGTPDKNTPAQYGGAEVEICRFDDDRDEWEDGEPAPANIENAALTAAMRNALPGLLARLRAAEAKVAAEYDMTVLSQEERGTLEGLLLKAHEATVKGGQPHA